MTDGGVHVCTIKQALKILSANSWAAPIRATVTVRKYRRNGPSMMYKITPAGLLSSRKPGGPPCWASPLASLCRDRDYKDKANPLSGSVFVSADGAGGGGCQAVIVYYVELVSSVYTVQL
jgi:hypothetical protein